MSDLNAREILVHGKAEKCHRLHFLQMAAEKACKAYLTKMGGHDKVRKAHAYIASTLPIIARYFYGTDSGNNQITQWELKEIKRLAREIELLAPACDDGDARRDNSEYPWQDSGGDVCIPCRYNFPNIDDGSRTIGRLIKLIRTACESYTR
jgi:hypothetical protein